MKHLFLISIIALAIPFVAFAKDKIIANPVYEFSNSGITHITKIELGKNETRLYIHDIFIPHWWVKYPKTTYIEDCATGKRWQATEIINGEFDQEIYMPDSGDSTFVLIFPPLDKSVTKINFCDNDEEDISIIFGISLDKKAKSNSKEIPAEVSQWIVNELAKAKRKDLMDFEANEFFATDTARLIGYIKGYDPRAGFSTGMVYARNEITGEDYPVVIQIHEDGRFEGSIPMNYPKYMYVSFNNSIVDFYIQPGQTLAMLLDWEDFRMADNIPKTQEDEAYMLMSDTLFIRVNSPDVSPEEREKLLEEYRTALQKFNERHGEEYRKAYKKKYIDVLKQPKRGERELEKWQIKDSVYTNVLKLKPGIVYDVTKIRSLDFMFREALKNDKEDAWNLLTALPSDIPESFLRKEADRLFLKNFPEEQRAAYELPDTYEAKIFKELITPFKGKILLVDFWGTTCAPCISNIKYHKPLRERYKDSPDVAFIFITSENESPSLQRYNEFVAEQELTNTYRLNADQYRYLRQLFRFNGIPHYILVDREGRILDDNLLSISSLLLEAKLKELIETEM